jgi:hypothetical protein
VILDDLALAAEDWRRRAAEAEAARRRLRSLMRDAARAGHTQRQIARAAGISRARASQILGAVPAEPMELPASLLAMATRLQKSGKKNQKKIDNHNGRNP